VVGGGGVVAGLALDPVTTPFATSPFNDSVAGDV